MAAHTGCHATADIGARLQTLDTSLYLVTLHCASTLAFGVTVIGLSACGILLGESEDIAESVLSFTKRRAPSARQLERASERSKLTDERCQSTGCVGDSRCCRIGHSRSGNSAHDS